MSRYHKLKNGDIFDKQTQTTISRDRLLDILNLDETTYKRAMEKYDELARDENSVLD